MNNFKHKSLLPYLHCFWHVACQHSFTRASQALHISQSAVSYQIKLLEEQLGVTLFDREKRRQLKLTPAGQVLADHCQTLFNGLQETLDTVQGKTLRGEINIAATSCFGSIVMGPVIADLKSLYPELQIHLDVTDDHLDLKAGHFDLAIRTISSTQGLYNKPLLQSPMRLVCSREYSSKNGLPSSLLELNQHHLILSKKDDTDWHSLCEQKPQVPVELESISYINNTWAQLHAIQSGAGMGYMPLYTVSQQLAQGECIEVLPEEFNDSYLILYSCSPHKISNNPKVEAVVDLIKQRISQEQYTSIFKWLDE